MQNDDMREDLGIPKSSFTDFMDDLKGRLAFISGKLDCSDFGLSLKDVRKPLLCVGLPGIGKTCGIMSIVNELNSTLPADKQFGFKKILLGQTVVGTLSGVPVVNNQTGDIKRAQAPELPIMGKDGEYGILFLDEITTADEAQVQPALGLCDDSRNIGEYTLPEHWLVVAAGNGPDCTNFLRLDDMTLSRFSPYDIQYSYKKDWRPWAHEHSINPMIIAYLNFKPQNCVAVESTEMDEAGKMFACPRTWERLSIELKMREAIGKPVKASELSNFAGRIIGKRVGREFAAFSAYSDDLPFDPNNILNGNERDPEPMKEEIFHILLEATVGLLKTVLDESKDASGNFPASTYQFVANVVDWFLKTENFALELCINAVSELRTSLGDDFKSIMFDSDFLQFSTKFDDFLTNHLDLILEADNEDLGF